MVAWAAGEDRLVNNAFASTGRGAIVPVQNMLLAKDITGGPPHVESDLHYKRSTVRDKVLQQCCKNILC
eukprot:4459408-Amphidinium_carterae.2